tara:strand:- start:72 stop:1604 length:1533 start_codon:yes stop_codon:yes gene_type:complete
MTINNIAIKKFDNTPDIEKLYDLVIPNIASYDNITQAFMDLVDNSWDAHGTKIILQIHEDENCRPTAYSIIDNGTGMNEEILMESYRFAGTCQHERGELGKFGSGGTTACFTYAWRKITLTKSKDGPLLVAELNLRESKSPFIRQPTKDEEKQFSKLCGKHGTIISIYDLKQDKMEYARSGDLKNSIVKSFGMMFYERLGASEEMYVQIPNRSINTKIKSYDPLFWDNRDNLKSHYQEKVQFGDHEIIVRFSLVNNNMLTGSEKKYENQGIYVSRNNRLIKAGGSLKPLWSLETQLNGGRVHISFNDALDGDSGINVAKNKIVLSEALANALEPVITKFKKEVRQKYKTQSNSEEVKKLSKEEEKFVQKIEGVAPLLKLPEIEAKTKFTRPGKAGKTGSKKSKGTGRTRLKTATKRKLPEFRHVKAVGGVPFWYDFEEGKMIININDTHNFIISYYNKANEKGKEALRKIWTAQCLVEHEYYNDPDMRDIISQVFNETHTNLDKVERLLK